MSDTPHWSSRRHRPRRLLTVGIVAAILVSGGLVGGIGAAASASGASTLALGPVNRLIQSTGNLYWTTWSDNEVGPDSASVYRASKWNTPGSEILLSRESRSDRFFFGDLTYANPGTWYGYFVVNYADLGRSHIKRVPLAGGTTTTLTISPSYVGWGDIDTDGTYLYWADAGGLRKMPVGGGTITTLVSSAGIESVGLDAGRVFYTAGNLIRSVPKAGGTSTTRATATTKPTSMHVRTDSTGTFVYWTEQNGSVKRLQVGSGVTTYQGATSSRTGTSVSFDGARVLWTDCATPGNYSCLVRVRQGSTTTAVAVAGVGGGNVQGDSGALYWGDLGGLRKYVY